MTDPQTPAQSTPNQQRFLAELFDAISLRTILLVLGVLLIQMGFVLSYVGAFHHPSPHRIPVALVAPDQVSAKLVTEINGIKGEPLEVTAVPTEAAARKLLSEGLTSGVLVINPTATTDHLLVASGGGAAVATAVHDVVTQLEATQHRTVAITDAIPAQTGDAQSLSGFYLVIGWLVGGYLVAALLGVSKGSRPATTRRAIIRLIAVVPYAILSGLGGALIVSTWLGALEGHVVALWWIGAFLVFCAAAVTMAFQAYLGVIGIGLTVVVFVVLGNPSAGGAYPPGLLPPFWRAISSASPNGAGVQAVRKIVYFHGYGIGGNLLVIAIWTVAGVALTVSGSALHARREAGRPTPATPSVA